MNGVALLSRVPVEPKVSVKLAQCMEAGKSLVRKAVSALLPTASRTLKVTLMRTTS